MVGAINKLVARIKIDLVNVPQTTTSYNGVIAPDWLPSGSASDQSALLIIGLINYLNSNNDAVIQTFIKSLADGIVLMQQSDSTQFPYGAFLSWQNTWHAYGNDQAYALMLAGNFLGNQAYTKAALTEVDNFYPWLLKSGYLSAFSISNAGGSISILSDTGYAQIAYGIEPMVFSAIEAYRETGQQIYADLAGHLVAWFLGANPTGNYMYNTTTGVCYDGIESPTSVNQNSGAESTIEALLSLQDAILYPAVVSAMNKYK